MLNKKRPFLMVLVKNLKWSTSKL